ncbi:MAG: hypothetical protein COU90_04475 [Candidatus Ryanbacteria bacterium CG10_big_fil_rev_8_21_14_0_10_43_42]|uniref:Tyrosine-protein kinase G-rich domain-containing protein n=1 Tax=Candidatus Ryanbacteria bacterium CG10_big_fil_rev_8_21_14_0_10_43_42 TaxID=1974864 RepID=A0A2M8KVZ8_9BACT|nr:MAG: hypothetical protein COU90_04475 [Candidatus Ryanbacteria bacterium CG10_big_fil_rev_8_21_14_0_10_43_42]
METWISILKKQWHIIVFTVCFLCVCGIFEARMSPKMYTSRALIQIKADTSSLLDKKVFPGGNEQTFYTSQMILLEDPHLAWEVIQREGLYTDGEMLSDLQESFLEESQSPFQSLIYYIRSLPFMLTDYSGNERYPKEGTAQDNDAYEQINEERKKKPYTEKYARFLDVERYGSPDTDIVAVSFTTGDPVLSFLLAAAHSDAFMDRAMKTEFASSESSRNFLGKKVEELKERLAANQKEVNALRIRSGDILVGDKETLATREMGNLQSSYGKEREARISLEMAYTALETRDNSVFMNNPTIRQAEQDLLTAESVRNQLLSSLTREHPRFKEAEATVLSARNYLENIKKEIKERTLSDVLIAKAREEKARDALQKKREEYETNSNTVGPKIAFLEREIEINGGILSRLQEKLQTLQMAYHMPISYMRVVQRAEFPFYYSSPNEMNIIVLWTCAGFLFGIFFACVREYFDRQYLWSREDVETVTNLSVLADIPLEDSNNELIVGNGFQSPASEAIKGFAAYILQKIDPPGSILFASVEPAAGKTFLLANLAHALLLQEKRIAFISADLHHPRCGEILGFNEQGKGLSDILMQESMPVKDCLGEMDTIRFFFIPCGTYVHDASSLLACSRMVELLRCLRDKFEYVLIDAPPLLLSDWHVLARQTDYVFPVVRSGRITNADFENLVRSLAHMKIKVPGILLNGTDGTKSLYSAKYDYNDFERNNMRNET